MKLIFISVFVSDSDMESLNLKTIYIVILDKN